MKESPYHNAPSGNPSYGETFSNALNAAMEDFKQFKYWRGIKNLSAPISRVMVEKIYRRFSSVEEVLNDHKLKPRQKGFEIAMKVFGALAFVPVVIGAIAGGAAMIAPMMLLCSSLETVKNFMFWRAERAERSILRQAMIKTTDLETEISNSGLNDYEKMIVNDFTFREAQIYSSLYKMRQAIIMDPKQDPENKQRQVEILNSAITSFSQQKLELLDFSELSVLPEDQKQFQLDLSAYNFACEKIKNNDIKMSKNLRSTIDLYKMSRAEIHSQNIPEMIKSKMVEMLERDKNTLDDVRDLQVRLVNHYINISHLQKDSNSAIEKYDSPQIAKIDDRRHLLDIAQNKVKETMSKYSFNFWNKSDKDKKEKLTKRAAQENATIAEFKKHGFNVKAMEDKLRLEHLEKSVNKRLFNAWLTFSGAAMHAAIVAIPLVLVTTGPGAAPLAAGFITFLTGASVAVGVASYTGALVLNHQDSKRVEKIKSIQKASEEASYEMSNEEVQAYKKSYEKKASKESKMDFVSSKVKAYLPKMGGFSSKKKNASQADVSVAKPTKPTVKSKQR